MLPNARFALQTLLSIPFVLLIVEGCSNTGEGDIFPSGSGAASTGAGHAGGAGGSTGGAGGQGGAGTGGAATGSGGASTSASGSSSSGSNVHEIAPCQNHVYECGDGVDNDGDGLVDSDDPDCLGPCDNTESSFFGGIPGQAGPPCDVDCYFDQDSGSGNDHCFWNHKCDPHEVAPGYYPESQLGDVCEYNESANISGTNQSCAELYAAQLQDCHDYCGPLTPNGCDCFGCCELPAGTGKYVWLGSEDSNGNGTCTLADLADPTKCQPCLPVAGCLNPCDKCELCIGKTMLPPECYPDGGSGSSSGSGGAGSSGSSSSGGDVGGQCPPELTPCGLPGQAACPQGQYCITGCCQKVPN